MEGRKPPPKASHPFPNNPDLTKFWGTPYYKGFFKSFGVFCLTFGIFSAFNMYLTRHQKGPLGLDVTLTREQAERRREVIKGTRDMLSLYKLPLEVKSRANQFSTDPEMRFDDGVNFNVDTSPKTVMIYRGN